MRPRSYSFVLQKEIKEDNNLRTKPFSIYQATHTMPQYIPTGSNFGCEPLASESCTARPSIDRGISLSMESRQVFYGATSSNTVGPQSSSRKIRSPEECQMQARKAMLSNFSKMFGF